MSDNAAIADNATTTNEAGTGAASAVGTVSLENVGVVLPVAPTLEMRLADLETKLSNMRDLLHDMANHVANVTDDHHEVSAIVSNHGRALDALKGIEARFKNAMGI